MGNCSATVIRKCIRNVSRAHTTWARQRRSAPGRDAFFGGAIALLAMFSGCAKPSATKTLPPPVLPQVQTDSPESAARSALLLMQNELRAVAARNPREIARIHEALMAIVARRDAAKALKNVSGAKSLLGEDVVSGMVELWTAALAHYSEEIDFATLSASQPQGANIVAVYVNATAGSDSTYLRVDCLREDSRWVIANFSIDVAGPPRDEPLAQPGSAASHPSLTAPVSGPTTRPLNP